MSTQKQNSKAAFLNAILPLTEGFVGTESIQAPSRNIFGRNIQYSFLGDTAWNLGLAAAGIRTLGYVDGSHSKKSVSVINQAIGQKLSAVFLVSYNHLTEVKDLTNTGAFVFSASSWQEVYDFTCIAWNISEKSLIPGIVLFPKRIENASFEGSFEAKEIKSFIGNPDQWIDCPTPAQKLIFGEKRKQIPNWFDPDLPVTIGSLKNTEDEYYDKASHESFIETHLNDIMDEAFSAFKSATGRSYSSFSFVNEKKADLALITTGEDQSMIEKTLEIYKGKKIAISRVQVQCIYPFPESGLKETLSIFRSLLILEKSLERNLTDKIVKLSEKTSVYSGLYIDLNESNLGLAIDNAVNKGNQNFWLDIALSQEKSNFPKHDVLLHNINRSYPNLLKENLVSRRNWRMILHFS